MGYTIELKNISVTRYMEILKNQDLLPGRRILLQDIETNFRKIKSADISNLYELKNSLSTPQKISAFSAKTSITEDYLTILKREMGSLEQKPVAIFDFPGISEQTVLKLSENNVKTSKDFYNLCHLIMDMVVISNKTSIVKGDLAELDCLCNLVRINGIGAVAARTMYEAGYKTIKDIASADAKELLEHISAVNSVKQYYKAKLGEKDMKFIIDFANLIMEVEET